ncbi:CueP family metal-binding protein [Photobacterium lipolyticum]|uniref:Uncharacterized protein n=1 Tax=Photobacterium lipolyticum TaxID=266810 RepID=A0A2T3N2U0_9GAMM|nr:CueP family metal-binding protein [Photobacterium lipolyticum]PSW06692.1 hypothetical protein C9I89_03935 [Photobacterium lipolyticum]
MKKNIIKAGLAVSALLASSIVFAQTDSEYFSSLTPQEAVKQSQAWRSEGKDTKVIITPTTIMAKFANQPAAEVPLGDVFFLSIAPWMTFTHPCTNHVPTGCTGELKNVSMMMTVKDVETGETVTDGMVRTQNDGFIDLWLPRNKAFDVSFSYQGLMSTERLTTTNSSRTCITTMKLKKA